MKTSKDKLLEVRAWIDKSRATLYADVHKLRTPEATYELLNATLGLADDTAIMALNVVDDMERIATQLEQLAIAHFALRDMMMKYQRAVMEICTAIQYDSDTHELGEMLQRRLPEIFN